MPRPDITKVQFLEARHPGLCEKVDRMFNDFALLKDVQKMIEAQYGERICLAAVRKYKVKFWRVQRDRIREMNAALAAFQEFASEERN